MNKERDDIAPRKVQNNRRPVRKKTKRRKNSSFGKIAAAILEFIKKAIPKLVKAAVFIFRKLVEFFKGRIILFVIIVVVIVAAIAIPSIISSSFYTPHMTSEFIASLYLSPLNPEEAYWKKDGQFMYYEDNKYTSELVIDVSDYNEEINWKKVKKSGINNAIIRLGYRGYETGKFKMDDRYVQNLKDAHRAGLNVGVYFVTQAVNIQEAIEEAKLVIDTIDGFDVNLPVYVDCEENGGGEDSRTYEVKDWTQNIIAFCETIESAGYRAGVYSYPAWIAEKLNMDQLQQYDIWFAKYYDTPYTDTAFNMWQFTSEAEIPGISTVTDVSARLVPKKIPAGN